MKLNSGTYGCIYKSETITCSNDREGPKDKYIAKVVEMKYSKIEFEIGEEIQEKIPCYEYFFAPIEYKCSVETKSLDTNLINECSAIKDAKELDEIGVGKIRNIHRENDTTKIYTLPQIVEEWQKNPEKNKYIKTLYLDTYKYLLKSIERLKNIEIIHNDIKGNNILYDVYNECPIIIDFGMSMKMKTIKEENPLKNEQLIFIGSNYFTKMFESVVLGKLKKNTKKSQSEKPLSIDQEMLKEWLYEFINDEDEFQNVFKHGVFNEKQQKVFIENYEEKINIWIPENKEIESETLFKTIFEEIKNKIDIYALGITHLYLCKENTELNEINWTTEENDQEPTIPFFDNPEFEGAFREVFSPYFFRLQSTQ